MNKDNNEQNRTELSSKQIKTITAVVQASSISKGVKQAGVSRTQFYQWTQDPIFMAELNRQRNRIINLALDELKASVGQATEALRELLKSQNEAIRLKVAESIIEKTLKAVETENIEERLSRLEREIEAGQRYRR